VAKVQIKQTILKRNQVSETFSYLIGFAVCIGLFYAVGRMPEIIGALEQVSAMNPGNALNLR